MFKVVEDGTSYRILNIETNEFVSRPLEADSPLGWMKVPQGKRNAEAYLLWMHRAFGVDIERG
jgi:hypothetical protein